ncbi:MAG: UDP-galactose-4-epimerase [Methanosaeta sp. PtaB.Bin039]|nr:MAG: UDP-galactose-4-epimerase [Methanosaeta sp. PtaB.Bin039]OPY44830.1 MAG: UDP-galactose-4-epimerase [Methanosaeta sp. PtaU1.Bin028]HOT06616.1 NAD-dependent epimerase/dehydratase family protein [Methanotrichaceae archaeon]HQF16644.1 NAD-dependent epimerase/dehydratase family protein [Methanotrichaceae archaeon]HQI91344.1 NAD-dependent epimerase/dehydratase family protein [Methanotrichaceae archaeon]
MLEDLSILVTGGTGFIGSHLVDALVEKNRVRVLDNFSSSSPEILSHLKGHPNFTIMEGDLMDPVTAYEAASDQDMVFHLAANPSVSAGATDTRVHLEQNALATFNVLEAMRRQDVNRIAFTSTSTVYGEADVLPTPEDYGPLKPISLYGASKLACEAMISSYCHTFDMQSWIFRFANIVGERGSHGVIVDFVQKLDADPAELVILGDGRQRKSYLEVKDCVQAMLYVVENARDEVNIFNIGSTDSVSVREIADIVVAAMGLSDVKYRFAGGVDGRGWKGDVRSMSLDLQAILALGWQPRHDSAGSIQIAAEAILKGRKRRRRRRSRPASA